MSDREPVGSMLNYVDNQIHEEGVSRLKLLLYPLLPWKELEKCTKPSEIYRMLESTHETREEALQIFLFALKAIGGSKRGKQCAEKAAEKLGPELTPPQLDFAQQSSKFRFFFWLVKVVRRLPEQCQQYVMQHFANVEDVNHRFIGNLPHLFIRLYQDKVVTDDEIGMLINCLEDCKRSIRKGTTVMINLEKCTSYLFNFRTEDEASPFSSGDEESTAPSMHEADFEDTKQKLLPKGDSKAKSRRRRRKRNQSGSLSHQTVLFKNTDNSVAIDSEHTKVQVLPASKAELTDSTVFVPVSLEPHPGDPPSVGSADDPKLKATPEHSTYSDFSLNSDDINLYEQQNRDLGRTDTPANHPVIQRGLRKKCTRIFLTIAAVVSILLMISILTLCAVFVWSPLSRLSPIKAQHSEGNVPILTQVNALVTEQISIQQIVDIDDSSHRVLLYLSDDQCYQLPTTLVVHNYSEPQISIPPVYMLEHSEIGVRICANTMQLESNRVVFYILRTVGNYISFNPRHPNENDYHKSVPVGTNGTKKCTVITQTLNDRDYYSVKFHSPENVVLTYNLTMRIRQLDSSALNTTPIGVIEPENDQKIEENIPFQIKQYCLFANIQRTAFSSTNNYTYLEVQFKPRKGASLGITLPVVLLSVIGGVVAMVITIGCYIYKRRQCGYTSVDN